MNVELESKLAELEREREDERREVEREKEDERREVEREREGWAEREAALKEELAHTRRELDELGRSYKEKVSSHSPCNYRR